jgi:general secretion pathway protein C
VFVTAVTLAALALLGLVLAYWTWVWFAPLPAARVQQVAARGPGLESAYGLFGAKRSAADSTAQSKISAELLGVVAASSGHTGYAVFRLDTKKVVAIPEGQDIEPGVRLAEVRPDHVILVRDGMRERLSWPKKSASQPFPARQPNK